MENYWATFQTACDSVRLLYGTTWSGHNYTHTHIFIYVCMYFYMYISHIFHLFFAVTCIDQLPKSRSHCMQEAHTHCYICHIKYTHTQLFAPSVCVCICFCEIPIVSYGPKGPRADGGVGGTVELLHMLQNIYVSCKEFALKAASSGRSAAAAAAAAATSW